MLYFEDCIEGCKKYIPNDSADLVIADPPYNLKFGGTSMTKNKRPRFGTFANDHLSPCSVSQVLLWMDPASLSYSKTGAALLCMYRLAHVS